MVCRSFDHRGALNIQANHRLKTSGSLVPHGTDRLGLGAEQAKPAKLSQMESKLQGQVMRDKAKAAGASGGESRAAKRKAEADKSDDDDEESRAGAIKSRIKTVSGTVQPLSKKQRKQLAKANAPSSLSPTASTSQLVGSASSKVPRGTENSHSPEHEHEHSVLGFPSEPSDQDYDVSEPDYGNKSFRIPFKPPITSDPPSPVDPTTDQSMASISAVPTPPTVTAPDDGQTSKQKKRKRNKQRRAEKRKQIRLSEGSHP